MLVLNSNFESIHGTHLSVTCPTKSPTSDYEACSESERDSSLDSRSVTAGSDQKILDAAGIVPPRKTSCDDNSCFCKTRYPDYSLKQIRVSLSLGYLVDKNVGTFWPIVTNAILAKRVLSTKLPILRSLLAGGLGDVNAT
jgi:hypothetical protein